MERTLARVFRVGSIVCLLIVALMFQTGAAISQVHLPVPTTLPPTTLPAVSTTLPAVPTTLPAVSTTLPAVTTTLPAVSTTLPAVSTTLPAVSTTLPAVTTTLVTTRSPNRVFDEATTLVITESGNDPPSPDEEGPSGISSYSTFGDSSMESLSPPIIGATPWGDRDVENGQGEEPESESDDEAPADSEQAEESPPSVIDTLIEQIERLINLIAAFRVEVAGIQVLSVTGLALTGLAVVAAALLLTGLGVLKLPRWSQRDD